MTCVLRVELNIIILLSITILSVFLKGTHDCHCQGGCAVPPTPCVSRCERGWDGAFCQRRNVALGQPSEQSRSFNDTPYCPPPDPHFGPMICGVKGADLAVDGDTDQSYWHGSCTHTIPGNTTARWSVDLGDTHFIRHIVIHTDEDLPTSFKTFQLYVDGQWCQNWTAPDDETLVGDILCSRLLVGSNVTFVSVPDQANQGMPVLELCEVEVYECSDFWFGISCDKHCHCRNISEVCDKVTGQCASGCALGRAGQDCQMINVAFNQSASQSSTYQLCGHTTLSTTSHNKCDNKSANLAVDGNRLSGSCSYTNPGQSGSYWSVDLGQSRDIHSIRIYNNKNHLNYTKGFKVLVDGSLCYQSDNTTTPSSVVDIICMDDMAGSNVSIVLPSWLPGQHMLSLCEIEIYECDNYRYGPNCDSFCNCNDVTEICNKTTGHCESGCAAGWSGLNCTQGCKGGQYGCDCGLTCGHCAYGIDCDPVTGLCQDGLCSLWWYGPRCNECRNGTYLRGNHCEPCSGCMSDDCVNTTGRCRHGCRDGYHGYLCNQQCPRYMYGKDCSLHCGRCRNKRPCEPHTGSCIDGCAQNFTETTCEECTVGLYGKECNLTCGECAGDGQCDKMTGDCTHGCLHNTREPFCTDCIRGQYGPQCNLTCGHCRYGDNCDRLTGICTSGCWDGWKGEMCLECDDFYYGSNCSKCGKCSNNKTCDATSGRCSEGCVPGWTTPKCNKECPPGFYGDSCSSKCGQCAHNFTCDTETGQCPNLQCDPGFTGPLCTTICQNDVYGANCAFPCGRCLDNKTCDSYNGQCPGGLCLPGYQEPLCHKECPRGFYGSNCTEVCDHCLDLRCDVVTGSCVQRACAQGYKGYFCMEAITNTKPGVIAAGVLVPVIVTSIIVGIGVWRWRRWRRDQPDQEMEDIIQERST